MEIKILNNLIKKLFSSALIFALFFFIFSAVIDIYYFNRVAHKEPGSIGQIAYSDFRVFWRASRNMYSHIREGDKLQTKDSPVYDKTQQFYHFRYSPLAAVLMIPFGITTYPATGLVYWSITLNILLFAGLILLTRRLGRDFALSAIQRYIILWITFFVMLRFYLTNISLGQTDILTAFLFVLFLISFSAKREALCGIIFALILQFKPSFLSMLLYFVFTGKRKLVISAFFSLVVFLIVPSVFVGWDKNIIFLKEWNDILGMSIPSQILNYKNQSITYALCVMLLKFKFIKTLLEPRYLFYATSAILTILAYAAAGPFFKNAKIRNEKAASYLEIGTLIIISLLFSPIVWVAHFMNLIIPVGIAALIVMKINREKRNVTYALFGGFIILSCVIGTDFTKFMPFINKLHFVNIALGVILLIAGSVYAFLALPPHFKDAA